MFTKDKHLHVRRPAARPPHGGWTGLQWREGAAVLHWLQAERRLHRGFDALAIALRATLDDLVQTASDARAVWRAAPAVLRDCNDPKTFSIPQAETAYAWLVCGASGAPGFQLDGKRCRGGTRFFSLTEA